MRQIAKMERPESYLEGFQLGKRISENPQNSSFPRYKNAVTSFKSKSCGITVKGRPGGRPTQDILQVSLKNNYEMRIDDNFPPMSFRA